MKKCGVCGRDSADDARFCDGCGADLKDVSGAGVCEESENSVQPAGSGRADALRRIFARIVMPAVAVLSCFVLFVSGFFIRFDYYTAEQVQARIDFTSGNADVAAVLDSMPVEQNVFNVLEALFTGTDLAGNLERQEELQEQLSAKMQNVMQKYSVRIAELTFAAEAGDPDAFSELISIYYDVAEDYAQALADVNVIQLDVLDVEIAYAQMVEDRSTDDLARMDKWLTDTYFRTGLLAVYSAGYIFLLSVSLVYFCISAAGLLKRKTGCLIGKYFPMYLIGCFVMMAAGQLTATSLNGTGMFCFIFAAAAALMYYGSRIFCTKKFDMRGIADTAVKAVCTVLSFAALCVLAACDFEFGVAVDKIGAVFGLHIFDTSYTFGKDAVSTTMSNFFAAAVPYLAVFICMLIWFARQMNASWKDRGEGLLFPAAVAGLALVQVIVFAFLPLVSVIELVGFPNGVLAVFLVCASALIVVIAGAAFCRQADRYTDAQEQDKS